MAKGGLLEWHPLVQKAMGSTTYIITSERFNPLTDYRLYTTHFKHFNFVYAC